MSDEEGDIEASVYAGSDRSREMSAMVSALTHVVSEGQKARQGLFMTPEPPPYIGVRQRDGGEWVAEIPCRWNLSCIGTFDTPEVAAMARDRDSFESRGDEARLNFPQLSLNINGAEPTAAPNAATNLNVGRSTLRRVCREYGIHRWPPHKLTSQSCRCEPPAVVDQTKGMSLNDAAMNLNVSRSTLKRACASGKPLLP
ncbi:hypothetical protein Vadar_005549 [Vaccinium darrowii]|uniref:Uncharacterized protein n=1 Tax=Vaccinium darrowii TaxID=229202 RepID=A0ACB7ZAL8_9ERIC|nr:hypothetical protein Vadar_005549 [Vaccinium darrowii]